MIITTKVSVIIPTYGEPDFITKAIESVLNQTIEDLELIIIDDNDPDSHFRIKTSNIVERLKRFDSRISYYCHNKNKNGASARNTGIQYAKGQYIAFLDSDDEYFPERLEKCLQIMDNCTNPKYAGVYTGCEFRKELRTYYIKRNSASGNFMLETLASTFEFCTGSNIFMRAEVVKALRFDESFLRHQDYEFLVRYFQEYSLIGLDDVLVIKNNENRNVPKPEIIIKIKRQYLNKYHSIINSFDLNSKNEIYFSNYLQISEAYALNGNINKTYEYYNQCRKYKAIPLFNIIKIVILLLKSMLLRIIKE